MSHLRQTSRGISDRDDQMLLLCAKSSTLSQKSLSVLLVVKGGPQSLAARAFSTYGRVMNVRLARVEDEALITEATDFTLRATLAMIAARLTYTVRPS